MIVQLPGGIAIHADSTLDTTRQTVADHCDTIACIIADPPYGHIIKHSWDNEYDNQHAHAQWMLDWTQLWADPLTPGGAFWVWGSYGKPDFRPYFQYLANVEQAGILQIANYITWKKKRARGIQWGMLQTREDLAYMVRGTYNKPRCFTPPYLEEKRGYPGYNKQYPAKSEYLRRGSVWTDITEILRGKTHPTQKPTKLYTIMIEATTRPGDWIIDPFAGSGVTAHAARETDRRYVIIERDKTYFDQMVESLR
jgi:DNA modification methylase